MDNENQESDIVFERSYNLKTKPKKTTTKCKLFKFQIFLFSHVNLSIYFLVDPTTGKFIKISNKLQNNRFRNKGRELSEARLQLGNGMNLSITLCYD